MTNFVDILEQYRNRRVFVTGHTGFKGAWLIYWLRRIGAEVHGYALPPEPDGLYEAMNGDLLCNSEINDVRDSAALSKSLIEFRPDYIFHLAAQSLVGESYRFPLETFETNVMGTAILLEAARELPGPTSIVVVTTDKVYQNLESQVAYKESDSLGGHDPYSSSKACTELVADSYRKSFFPLAEYSRHQTTIATARSGNVMGGGDWNKDHLMPDIVRALLQGGTIKVRNPSAVRPWQHVLEPLWGYLLLGAKMMSNPSEYSGAWNFGPRQNDAITVERLVRRCISEWGTGEYEAAVDENAPHEANLLFIDSSKAQNELQWCPTFSVDESVQITLRSYKAMSRNPEDVHAVLDKDIESFSRRQDALRSDDK